MIIEKPAVSEPPPYSSSHDQTQAQAGSSAESTTQYTIRPPPSDARRCNHLTMVVEDHDIVGAFIIDPSLEIHESFLAPLEKGETTRANLKLKITTGRLDVDIWVIPSGPTSTSANPTRLVFNGPEASVDARIHTLGEAPCHVIVDFEHQNGKVTLPHDFVGKIFVNRSYGEIKKLPNRVVVVSDVLGKMKSVVGDLAVIGKDGWEGHTVNIKSSNADVQVAFMDEVAASNAAGGGGFWSLFGY